MTSTLYTWIEAGNFTADISFRLDSLSLVFCFVITFVGALIHLYSVEFMKDDEGFTRFFTYMNLFVASMLILVLVRRTFASLPGMGRRGSLQLPANRFLVQGT